MGNIEQIEQLETYINDLGDEIKRVKKASEYLKLIEQFQGEVANASVNLEKSGDNLKVYQEIVESKLELFHTTSKNLEAKQQFLENNQKRIIESLAELKQQILTELNRIQDEQKSVLKLISQANKKYTIINIVMALPILGILVYLLIK
ncbi:hypothetical protein [Neobacillus sp. LXY-4]|uniref:hypothetical protein n=1 Tax=Neobacillus sp. LXY-4 TaxID=3379826 RepID=UPI003EDFBD42